MRINDHLIKLAVLATFAASAVAQSAVPIEKEPMHRLKFKNEFVRVFDILIPVGKTSLYHTHLYDGVSIRLSATQIIDEVLGGDKSTFEIKYGVATFSARPSPLTHRVVNGGKSDFRNIFIEILQPKSVVSAGVLPVLSDGHVVLLENERVRINRLVLKPGESSKPHTHTTSGLGITLYDSNIEITSSDGSKRTLESRPGDFVWQNAGTAHIIRNVGSKVFEAIDIEIK